MLGDSAYGSGAARATLGEAGHQALIKPIPLRAPAPGGFTADDFDVDHAAGTVTCPNGLTRTITLSGAATFGAACRGCPLQQRFTTSRTGRTIKIGEHEDTPEGFGRTPDLHHSDVIFLKGPLTPRQAMRVISGSGRALEMNGPVEIQQLLIAASRCAANDSIRQPDRQTAERSVILDAIRYGRIAGRTGLASDECHT